MNTLTIPGHELQACMRQAMRRRDHRVYRELGLSHWQENHEWLVRSGWTPGRLVSVDLPARSTHPHDDAGPTPTGDTPPARRLQISLTNGSPSAELRPDLTALLLLGRDQFRGQARGIVRHEGVCRPIHRLKIVGPGMHTLWLDEPVEEVARDEWAEGKGPERWSRTIGALGLDVWRRLAGLHFGIIGAGRTGSSVLRSLVYTGIRRLTLVDPDVLEAHNLGEMQGIGVDYIGRTKVAALCETLAGEMDPGMGLCLSGVCDSITRIGSLRSLQPCDLLICCVDHDSARLAAAIIATTFAKPLVDIATGVHDEARTGRRVGADVRLVLPGQCLMCFGGLRDPTQALRILESAEAESQLTQDREWRSERAGSLASLNQCAAAVALRLLEDFVAERIQESTWAHLEFDQAGHLQVTYPAIPMRRFNRCPICKFAGRGQDAVSSIPGLIRDMSAAE